MEKVYPSVAIMVTNLYHTDLFYYHLSLDSYYDVSVDFCIVILLRMLSDILNVSFWISREDPFSLTGPLQGVNGGAAEGCSAASAFFVLRIESAEMAWSLPEFMRDPCSLSNSF